MGGRGSTSGLTNNSNSGRSTLQNMLEYARSITQKKIEAVKNGTNVVSYEYDGKTYHQYYYGGAWHDRPSTLTNVRQYQAGDFDRIIDSQKRRRRKR